jgi:hypothetical protein
VKRGDEKTAVYGNEPCLILVNTRPEFDSQLLVRRHGVVLAQELAERGEHDAKHDE